MIANSELKYQMRASGISQWMIADVIGVSENTINRWMRHELDPDHEHQIKDAIEVCKAKRKEGD